MISLYSNKFIKPAFKNYLHQKLQDLSLSLDIVQVGDNLASAKYVGIKKKIGDEIGVKVNHHHFDDTVLDSELVDLYNNAKDKGNGFIFQLPLPAKFDHLVPQTPLSTDVDLLSLDSGRLWEKSILPPTIGAIDLILKEMKHRQKTNDYVSDIYQGNNLIEEFLNTNYDYSGLTVAIVGQGTLVGNPLLKYLRDRFATIISVNKTTKNSPELVKNADIVFCGAGVAGLVKQSWLKPSAIVIDAATSGTNGQIFGDVDMESLTEDIYICPSPKGVGPITVIYIFWNLFNLNQINYAMPKMS
jgi:methylenetetrahydrofolate dehydrogenase (NADP+) / methenyltetrahydrofolate cyclohydrolase